ncbi:MAG: CDP-diacylglycerol--glycerol-3-phosphate 3-phosphatidyltransferase [Candidatus Omnitrophica bacterium]|nr:CDP-diacylglycerol--glycerol-3-phosphate 3-phosphatidyltransferase [Candidatus Omnitrophota bacterium]
MTLPTKVTVLRVLLTVVIMGLLAVPGLAAKVACLVLFVVASLTDWLDGYLARRLNQTSPLGILLDPIADKMLILGVLISFVQLRLVPAWMVVVILARELLITGVRLYAASRKIVIAAAKEGKHKTVSQIVTVVLILVWLVIREIFSGGIPPTVERVVTQVITVILWMTVLLTVISGASFFWRHRGLLRDVTVG